MRSDNNIELPADLDLAAFVKRAYALSRPNSWNLFSMDYVHGRAVKLTLYKDDDGLFVPAFWYDHSTSSYIELLTAFGVSESTILAAQVARDTVRA